VKVQLLLRYQVAAFSVCNLLMLPCHWPRQNFRHQRNKKKKKKKKKSKTKTLYSFQAALTAKPSLPSSILHTQSCSETFDTTSGKLQLSQRLPYQLFAKLSFVFPRVEKGVRSSRCSSSELQLSKHPLPPFFFNIRPASPMQQTLSTDRLPLIPSTSG
jgi:hypothetical protein